MLNLKLVSHSFCQIHNYEIDITGALLRRGKEIKIIVQSETQPSRAAIQLIEWTP